jgi:hypothetical protein
MFVDKDEYRNVQKRKCLTGGQLNEKEDTYEEAS